MDETDIIILPSYYRDGVPKCLIEGLSLGKPIITTDTPGCREVVKKYINGILIKPRSHEALAEAMT